MLRLFGVLLVSSTILAGPALAVRFEILPDNDTNLVRFESKAVLHAFEGTTKQFAGYVVLDPDDLGDSVTIYIEVNLASLDTGIERRNRSMRNNHLETHKYPTAVFKGATIVRPRGSRLDEGRAATFDIEGVLDLHGLKRTQRAAVEVTYLEESGVRKLHVIARLDVKLTDFAIERPSVMFMKVRDTQKVTFEAIATAAPD